jgi:hypothetical protein
MPRRNPPRKIVCRVGNLGRSPTVPCDNGTIHDFVMLNGVSRTPAARAAIAQANAVLNRALHK